MSHQPVLADRPLHVGASVSRVEDDRLLRGGARYVADIEIPDMADVAIVRSPLAHADLGTVDVEPATRDARRHRCVRSLRPGPTFSRSPTPTPWCAR